MKRPQLQDYKPEEINDGADMADWYESYYKALDEYIDYIEEFVPDLLEALQNTLNTLESLIGTCSDEWVEVKQAKEAIKKDEQTRRSNKP